MANETNPAVLSAPHDNSESEEPDNLIKSFVEKWNRKEYKKYASLAEGARKLFYQKFCEKPPSHFPISPVKCIIQARAKSSETIEQSIRRREKDRTSPDFEGPDGKTGALGPFTTAEEIRQAMPDLAGIRVILVFPDDEDKITDFIEANTIRAQLPNYWGVKEDGSLRVDRFTHKTKRKDRFVGYRAVHYRVNLREEISDDSNLANGSESLKSWWRKQWKQNSGDSWAKKDVEIQVTSMTMYAWQEVHHDLIYKTYEGKLTDDEVSTLDMVNGLVHANEIALNQFHRSLNKRLDSIRTKFRDETHLENWIATYVQEEFHTSFKNESPYMRYSEKLFHVLQFYQLDTPEKLVEAIKDVAGQVTSVADKEIDTESIQHALDLIKEWRLELEQGLKAGRIEIDIDASAWVLFKICESKSPFKTIASDGKTRREFIAIATFVMEEVFASKSKPDGPVLIGGSQNRNVSEESGLGQMMLWSGQKFKRDFSASKDESGFSGTWESLLRNTRAKLRAWKSNPDNPILRGTYLFNVVCLALALLKISVIPYLREYQWREQSHVFWPGTMNLEAMAARLQKSEEYIRDMIYDEKVRTIRWHNFFLVMVDDKWEHLHLTDGSWQGHRWVLIKTEIPDAMNSLDLATLSKTYSEEWLKAPGLEQTSVERIGDKKS